MKVLFITLFSKISGSSRIMVYQFLPFLEKAGMECKTKVIYPDRFFKVQMGLIRTNRFVKYANLVFYLAAAMLKRFNYAVASRKYDVVFIQRDTFPKLLYWLMKQMNPRIIYEFEDTFEYTNPFLKRSFIHSLLLSYQKGLFRNMVAGAAHVIAVNDYVAKEAGKANKNVSVICEPINTDFFRPREYDNSGVITIGWIGSPSTTIFLKGIAPIFQELGKRFPNARLKIVGAAPDFSVEGISCIKKEWNLGDELADLQSFDIGLMPFDDSPFYKGHLGHKMIQYMSVGIPVIASNDGLNPTVIKDGINGFLADTNEEWIEKISLLLQNAELCRQLGANGRKIAEESFSLKKNSLVLTDVLNKVAKG